MVENRAVSKSCPLGPGGCGGHWWSNVALPCGRCVPGAAAKHKRIGQVVSTDHSVPSPSRVACSVCDWGQMQPKGPCSEAPHATRQAAGTSDEYGSPTQHHLSCSAPSSPRCCSRQGRVSVSLESRCCKTHERCEISRDAAADHVEPGSWRPSDGDC